MLLKFNAAHFRAGVAPVTPNISTPEVVLGVASVADSSGFHEGFWIDFVDFRKSPEPLESLHFENTECCLRFAASANGICETSIGMSVGGIVSSGTLTPSWAASLAASSARMFFFFSRHGTHLDFGLPLPQSQGPPQIAQSILRM